MRLLPHEFIAKRVDKIGLEGVAGELGCSMAHISMIQNQKRTPSIPFAKKIQKHPKYRIPWTAWYEAA